MRIQSAGGAGVCSVMLVVQNLLKINIVKYNKLDYMLTRVYRAMFLFPVICIFVFMLCI